MRRRNGMKKISYIRIFIKKWAACLCIAVLISIVGTLVARDFYRSLKSREFEGYYHLVSADLQTEYNNVYKDKAREIEIKEDGSGGIQKMEENREVTAFDALESVDEERLFSLWKARAHWILSSRGYPNCAFALYDSDTKELYADTRDVVFIFLREIGETSTSPYECPVEAMQEAVEDYNEIWSEGDPLESGISFHFEDVYLKDGECLPGRVKLVQLADREDLYMLTEDTTVIKEYDFTPEDVTGYRHVMLNQNDAIKTVGPVLWPENERAEAVELIHYYLENEPDDIWEHSNLSMNRFLADGIELLQQRSMVIGGDMSVKLIGAARFNMLEDYWKELLCGYISTFICTIVLALILAYRSFMIMKNRYQMDQYRRDMTNTMAHDLKTPLMAISGYAENLQNNVHSEKKNYYAGAIVKNVQYMNRIIGNVLELAKVEEGERKPEPTEVNLRGLTEEILEKYEILAADKNVTVDLEGDAEVKADRLWMTQALDNLISNAVKYSAKDTQIQIALQNNCYEIRNRIAQSTGMSAEELWKPFVRGDNSRADTAANSETENKPEPGTGIGLAIVKNVLEIQGFKVKLEETEDEFIVKIFH